MKIFGYTPYGFSLRLILITMIGFIAVVVIQMYQYGSSVDKLEQQLFTAWPDQAGVALYKENCEKGSISRDEYDCAKKYASVELSNAIKAAHNSMQEPPAPLKYL